MAGIARVVVPELPHHATQRGNRRQLTFFGREDLAEYRRLMAASCKECGTRVWVYCPMPNHVHFVIVTIILRRAALRCAVAEAPRRYAQIISFRAGHRGHLWQERFHSFVMDKP